MNVTQDEAIRIYARASRSWFGSSALQKTQDRIDQLRWAGDAEGVEVWERVKRAIAELNQSDPATVSDEAASRRASA